MPIAIVTGGNSGIGRAIAVALAREGHDVGITWHSDEENAAEALDEIRALGVRAESARMDLGSPDPADLPAGAQAADRLAEGLGGIDVFVNVAGAGHSDPFLELGFETFMRVLDTDLIGAFCCLQAAARRMVAQQNGGRLIAVTSVHEHVPLLHSSAYVTAKHGLGGLVKGMALELAEHGITVNAIAPGEIATRMTGQEDTDPGSSERPGIPAGRPGHAAEVASAAVWLARPEARYTTGQSIVVDGGLMLMAAMANRVEGGH